MALLGARRRIGDMGKPAMCEHELSSIDREYLTPRAFQIRVSEERYVRGYDVGPTDAPPVIRLHGTPGSGLNGIVNYVATAPIFCRLIALDRQGYGGSTPAPGRKVKDIAELVGVVMDHLLIERAAVFGASGGGPHALATAALLPDRISRVASLAGIGPSFGPGFNYADNQVPLMQEEMLMARAGRDASRDYYRRVIARDDDPEIAAGLYCENDLRVGRFVTEVYGGIRKHIESRLGLNDQSYSVEEAYLDDFHSFTAPWEFDLASISVPVRIYHGLADIMVPPAHSRWLQSQIPNAELELFPKLGHSFEQLMPHVYAWLAQGGR
ncbi:alpha/beta fold hydrolase [Sinorhizobium medicae]|uniref:alpha/beta fold hydrolase n=1 Tax=Sinorhizobium medicae TaxID=110321 RepID=UPI001297D5ED|nr:alpha/beta fold hydrolase [Sinorhizobium medicae]